MKTRKLPDDFKYLPEMYNDDYYPPVLVDKVTDALKEVVVFIEEGSRTTEEIQEKFDQIVRQINELQKEFEAYDSELETVARESIGETVDRIIQHFDLEISTEDAIRERDW